MISASDFRKGVTIEWEDGVWNIVDFQHVKPGKGAAFVRVKLRNVKNGNVQEMTFRGDEKIEEAYIEERKLQYQYASGGMFYLMDQDNYEEISINEKDMGDKVKFLLDNIEVTACFFKNEVLTVNLPNFIEVRIKHTEPGIKGDTAKSGTKPAEIETGTMVQVPLFIEIGDTIKVDTRSGGYVERINK